MESDDNKGTVKIDVWNIVTDHWATIVNANTLKPDWSDKIIFIGLPVAAASLLVCFGALMNNDVIADVISGLSIFVGLLFNVLVIIFDIVKRDSYSSIKNALLKQALTNISFAILLALFSIITCLVTLIKFKWVMLGATWLTYFLLVEFVVCLLMILKRMYKLLMNEFKTITTRP